MKKALAVPVVLTVYNRPNETRAVFEAIRAARPRDLYVIADAPRIEEHRAGCEAARSVVAAVDWDCAVHKNYAENNLGPKVRLSTGISWVFEQVDRAIILEHDCVPHPDFFPFCAELLEKYKDDERVMHIAGSNFNAKNPAFSCPESYYYSTVPHIWGWATWRRAWAHYDPTLSLWPACKREGWLASVFPDPAALDRWTYLFENYYHGKVESWDGQWAFACCINHALSINPRVNLVSNIGFGPEALNTTDPNYPFANLPTEPLEFPLVHPRAFTVNVAADAYAAREIFDVNRTRAQRLRWFAKSHFPSAYAWFKQTMRGTAPSGA